LEGCSFRLYNLIIALSSNELMYNTMFLESIFFSKSALSQVEQKPNPPVLKY
jgi:hypothetical protein